jgi:predicted enzyme related to lactoylglutathione lyase
MTIKGIHLIWINVSDIKKAVEYYTKVIGLTLKEFNQEFGWAELQGQDGTRLGIAQANPKFGTKAGINAVATITVDNLEKYKVKYKKDGVNLVGDTLEVPNEVKMQTFQDADGNTFQLVELLKPMK